MVNAFYHRDYTKYEPVTIEIEPECIRIINCPGIDRSVPDEVIKKGIRFRSRYYRNRRLGEFLHELDLCEGHCTGIPTMQEELEKNGSPAAFFETDPDRQSVCVTIPIHPRFLEKEEKLPTGVGYINSLDSQNTNQGTNQAIQTRADCLSDKECELLSIIKKNPQITQEEASKELGWKLSLVKYYFTSLKKKGKLIRKGTSQNGHWELP